MTSSGRKQMRKVSAEVPARLRAAWSESFLAEIPDNAAKALMAEAWEAEVHAGDQIHPELYKPRPPHLLLVLAGIVRVYRTSPEGRQVTLRHGRTGDVIGTPSVVANAAPAGVQAVTVSRILHLPVDTFRSLAQRDAAVSWAMTRELARSLFGIQERLAHHIFATVRARVARQLLDLAQEDVPGRLAVHASQQEVADAIGSVREVVGRIMSALREEGVVERRRDAVIILDQEALRSMARAEDASIGWSEPTDRELMSWNE
jgi:CRP/FNR family transcriptional regulator